MTLVLGSASPRRAELLTQLGYEFRVQPADIDERRLPHEPPRQYVRRLAAAKARKVAREAPTSVVLGADTIVAYGDRLLGKPRDRAEGMAMLALLSGRSHWVLSGVALCGPRRAAAVCVATRVTFRSVSVQEAAAYWEAEQPQDKAGGYGIQGAAGIFVKQIEGSYSNVVGLPLVETRLLLHALGQTAVAPITGDAPGIGQNLQRTEHEPR